MSLFATDEQNAYSGGFTDGEKAGFKKLKEESTN